MWRYKRHQRLCPNICIFSTNLICAIIFNVTFDLRDRYPEARVNKKALVDFFYQCLINKQP
jgi:hypothetical protein